MIRYSPLFLIFLLLDNCGRQYEWGSVVSLRQNDPIVTCGGRFIASIQLETGGRVERCMDTPVGTRIRVCVAGSCQAMSPSLRVPE